MIGLLYVHNACSPAHAVRTCSRTWLPLVARAHVSYSRACASLNPSVLTVLFLPAPSPLACMHVPYCCHTASTRTYLTTHRCPIPTCAVRMPRAVLVRSASLLSSRLRSYCPDMRAVPARRSPCQHSCVPCAYRPLRCPLMRAPVFRACPSSRCLVRPDCTASGIRATPRVSHSPRTCASQCVQPHDRRRRALMRTQAPITRGSSLRARLVRADSTRRCRYAPSRELACTGGAHLAVCAHPCHDLGGPALVSASRRIACATRSSVTGLSATPSKYRAVPIPISQSAG